MPLSLMKLSNPREHIEFQTLYATYIERDDYLKNPFSCAILIINIVRLIVLHIIQIINAAFWDGDY